MYILLDIFWFGWVLKYVLFWLYLWQLKEYHTGRFVDHFRTSKGKKLLFNFEQIFKLFLLIVLFLNLNASPYLISIITLVYLAELVIFGKNIYLKNFKKPVKTFKTIFLTCASFAVVVLFLFWTFRIKIFLQPILILGFDIVTPIIISAIVLFFQPFFVFARNLKLKKAENKLEKIRNLNNLKIIAITGSYGKTSTKEFLTTILSKKFKVLSTSAHQNSEIGIANCILNDLKPSHQVFIAEIGAYNKGKVREVCNILKPKFGIITGVNEQHLSLFGSMKNLLLAEGGQEMSKTLPECGTLFLNGDNKYCLDLYKKDGKYNKKIYSIDNKIINSDVWSDSVEVFRDYISFLAVDKTGSLAHFDVKVLGKQNVQNLLGAILVAKELGMPMGEISEACKNIIQEQGGMVLKQGKHGIDIIDSSYSANPDGVFADLKYLSIFPNKKIIVMPCLIELGKKSSEIHEKIGKGIATVCDLAIITSKDKFKEIEKGFNEAKLALRVIPAEAGIQSRSPNHGTVIFCDKPEEIYSAITLFAKSGDTVLLEGRVPNKLHELF